MFSSFPLYNLGFMVHDGPAWHSSIALCSVFCLRCLFFLIYLIYEGSSLIPLKDAFLFDVFPLFTVLHPFFVFCNKYGFHLYASLKNYNSQEVELLPPGCVQYCTAYCQWLDWTEPFMSWWSSKYIKPKLLWRFKTN